jgi:hypothetical protein
MEKQIKYILVNIENTENGHIMQFTECETGKTITARVSGGISNIEQIKYDFDGKDSGWDNAREFYFYTRELKNREFNALWKGLDYAGCERKEIQDYIRRKLSE